MSDSNSIPNLLDGSDAKEGSGFMDLLALTGMEAVDPKLPPVPMAMEDLGIPESVVLDLVLRRIMLDGVSCLEGLSASLALSIPIVERMFRMIRDQKYIDVKGMVGSDYHFSLTATGRALAAERFKLSQYAAQAPVPLDHYHEMVRRQKAEVRVGRSKLKKAFSDLVIPDRLIDDLGPAIISQSSMFLYGPPGNGKSSIAERLHRVYEDHVVIPRAVAVDGQIINLFDPVIHEASEEQPASLDPRWVLCKRPRVMVGGELSSSMLDLRLDASTGIYSAPLQMKANNGIFLIDDFGRQLMSPTELLNRWIVPLDRRVDYLSLSYGVKFQIPFDVMVIFSTNLSPKSLGDDAFFRRIQNKIYIDPVGDQDFDQILATVTKLRGIHCTAESAAYMRKLCKQMGNGELRACYPNDVCKLLYALCEYEGTPRVLNKANLDRILKLYFTKLEEAPSDLPSWDMDSPYSAVARTSGRRM